jgi:hypothetical protein
MAELLVTFTEPTRSTTGELYWGRALGRPMEDNRMWEGWLEFTLAGDDTIVSTPRETEQPNRADLLYWAEGLSAAYLEGALARALRPAPHPPAPTPRRFVPAAPRSTPPRGNVAIRSRVVLDPFQTYAEGEQLLRSQLHALSHDHLQNIVEAYGFTDDKNPDWARTASDDELAEHIVSSVRKRLTG